ncbi:MAG: GrdB-related putative oxidoreductase [Sarcina sp.]
MKVLLIFDQIQAGMGGKENAMQALGGKTTVMGSASMLEPALNKVSGKVCATLYCGDGFFEANTDMVKQKMIAMINKIKPDIVVCGPAYDYKGFAKMSAVLTEEINSKTDIPALCAMAEQNSEVITEFKDKINIVKMPKKGGIGLSDSLNNICVLAKEMYDKADCKDLKEKVCY